MVLHLSRKQLEVVVSMRFPTAFSRNLSALDRQVGTSIQCGRIQPWLSISAAAVVISADRIDRTNSHRITRALGKYG
jgi:hypothetical protein